MRLPFSLFCFFSILIPAMGQDHEEEVLSWGGRVILESSFSENHGEGQIDFLAPLFVGDDSLIFLYPTLGLSSDIDPGFSIGGGFRQYVENWNAVLGFGAFFDRYDSPFGNYYNQLGLSGELLTDRFDFRFNYYLPESDRNVIDSQRTSETSRSVSFDQPFATGHQIRQDITTTTTTIRRLFERYEESMQGFDTEFGVPVPVLDRLGEVKVFVGYYDFENKFGPDLSGMKSRAELRFSEKLAIDATWYEDEELAGENWVFGFRVNLPIAPENLEFGGSPFRNSFDGLFGRKTARDNASMTTYPFASRDRIRGRLLEEVLRSNRVQTSRSGFMEKTSARKISQRTDTETKVIADDIIFVNNGGEVGNGIRAGRANGNGTAERPVDSVGTGVERLVSRLGGSGTVYVQGGGSAYEEDVSVGFNGRPNGSKNGRGVRNVVFTSSFKGIPACGGLVFGGDTPRAAVSGFDIRGGTSGTVRSAVVEGFQITGMLSGPNAGIGVYAENVRNLEISCNQIHSSLDTADALRILYNGGNAGRINIFENVISVSADDADAIDVDVEDDALVRATVRGNRISTTGDNADGIDFGVFDDSVLLASISQNRSVTASPGSSGLDFDSEDDAFFSVIARNNIFRTISADANAVDIETEDDSEGGGFFAGNTVTTAGFDSDAFDVNTQDNSFLIFDTLRNRVRTTGIFSFGFDLTAEDGSFLDSIAEGDRISTTNIDSDAFSVGALDGAGMFITLDRARITTEENNSFGVFALAEDFGFLGFEMFDTQISTRGESSPGFVTIGDSASGVSVVMGGNTISTVGTDSDGVGIVPVQGINFTADGGSNTVSVTGLADDVFVAPAGGLVTGTVIINDNLVSPPVTGDFP